MTRLEALNYILARAGRGAVPALDTGGGSDASFAERELERADLAIQKIGWHFNTFRDYELTVDDNDELTVPDGTIWIDTDAEDAARNVTQVGGKLYDLDENRGTFPDDTTMKVRYCVRRTLECIPYPVREYIMLTAAFHFVSQWGHRFMAPTELARARADLYQEMNQARADAKRFNANTSNTNILDAPDVQDVKGRRYRGSILESL